MINTLKCSELLESNIAESHHELSPEKVNKTLNEVTEIVNESPDATANESSGELVDESVHFKRIEEAKKLLDMGAITQEEFDLIKRKHLKKM